MKFRNFEAGDYVPQVTVRWDPPDFAVPGRTLRYRVYAGEGGGLTETKRSEGLSAEIYLENIDDLETSEEVYAFFVKNEVNVKGGVYDSASERCDFNTIQRGERTVYYYHNNIIVYLTLCSTVKPQYSGHLWAMKIDHYKEVVSL